MLDQDTIQRLLFGALGGIAGAAVGGFFTLLYDYIKWRKNTVLVGDERRRANQEAIGKLIGSLLSWFAIAGGLFGIGKILTQGGELFQALKKMFSEMSPIGSALAQSAPRDEIAPILPYAAAFVLAIMGVSFLVALFILLTAADTKENQVKIKAADNIVKTFGGFFTGLATTLLH